MNFSIALDMIRGGRRLARTGWNGKGMWVACQASGGHDRPMNRDFLYLRTADGGFVPWIPSQSDLFAEDWHVVNGGAA